MFQSIAGKENLEKADLEPALKDLKDRLMTKNVAAMKDALVRILTPRRSIDILRNVHVSKEQRKPYVVVFVGVNRVGKSINLAKVAYWLHQHDINVMMAACDTFRSGTIEQLCTHARRLQALEAGGGMVSSILTVVGVGIDRDNGVGVVNGEGEMRRRRIEMR
ncbi:unnamed protein product [Lactuca saligna]|uniref:SRP54-type proteins GTP-binding domain-containing protein n=1 Tax=Lactuca saligna TaxID=75948 RepID=A0AA35Y9R0_LACSI|nr:unnamed protein product [Lactuca saligna]